MVKTLILTQGQLAQQLLESARIIAGELPGIEALGLDWGENLESARSQIRAAVQRLDDGDGVLVLTDLHGATPTNAARTMAAPGRVAVVCGVNLPMVVRLGCRGCEVRDLDSTAAWIAAKGASAVVRLEPKTSPVPVELST